MTFPRDHDYCLPWLGWADIKIKTEEDDFGCADAMMVRTLLFYRLVFFAQPRQQAAACCYVLVGPTTSRKTGILMFLFLYHRT